MNEILVRGVEADGRTGETRLVLLMLFLLEERDDDEEEEEEDLSYNGVTSFILITLCKEVTEEVYC